jgi:hypothetical protein
MMSTAASLSSVVKSRFIELVGESQTSEGDACKLRDTPNNDARIIAGASSPSSNAKTAHNTSKKFASNLR